MFGTDSDTDAAACVNLILSLPVVAWVGHANGSKGIGSIVDILAQEAKAAFEFPNLNVHEIRDMTARYLFQMGSGVEAFAPYADNWRQVKPFLQRQADVIRQNVAITRAATIDISKTKVSELLLGCLKQPDDISGGLVNLQLGLQREIATRGDRRISAPNEVAWQFVESVVATAMPLINEPAHFAARVLKLMHVEPAEIERNTTMADIKAISMFRRQVVVAGEAAGQIWDVQQVCRLKMDQIPSWVIETALRQYRQDLPERKGGEINDGHLACLAPYADLLFVDKRTMENLRRALPKVTSLRRLIENVKKTSLYSQALIHLR